ncbi:MAG: ABC transporter ATP-binding protein [Verrucomicrobiota bacterium]
MKLELKNVSVIYQRAGSAQVVALDDVSFAAETGDFICLFGPSGCGKTTILNLLGGFILPTRGRVIYDGSLVTGPAKARGVVFQQHNLFPWLSVRKNVEFGPRACGHGSTGWQEMVGNYLESAGLLDFAEKFPAELSVGMQQRVAIVRAFANNPDVLLMDEPFSSLDDVSTAVMHKILRNLLDLSRKTVVIVTHNVDEAIKLADVIICLSPRPGKVTGKFDLREARKSPDFTESTCRIREEILNLMSFTSADTR